MSTAKDNGQAAVTEGPPPSPGWAQRTGAWDAARERVAGTGPIVACFFGWEKSHPKPLTGRNGVEAESSYIEKPLPMALAPGNPRWLIAPYITPAKRRLGRDPIGSGASLEMRLLLGRVVDPEGQRDEWKRVVKAREEWWSTVEPKLARLVAELRPFVWADDAGITLVWALPEPFAITTAAEAKRWGDWYFAVRKHLGTVYKLTIEGDGAGFDALFPAPTCEPAHGDTRDVPVFTAVPFPPPAPPAAPKRDSEEHAKRIADVNALLDEIAVTMHERASKLSETEAATLLAACSGKLPPEVAWTQYEAGKTDTINGAAHAEPFAAFGVMLTEYAKRVVAKGTGRSFIGAVSRNGRCRDGDIEAIHIITLDCDGRGEWDRIRRVLDEARLAYIVQRSSSHTAGKPKWHLTIPLAHGWSGDKPAWRAIWRFLIGTFGGIAGLPVAPPLFGFDNTTDRLGQPIFPSAKRTKDQAPPETIVVASGHALDLDELLARGGFDPAWRTARTAYEPSEPSSVAPSDGLLALAFAKAGMLGQRIERASIKGYAVECPRERLHSSGRRFDSSTMIADPSGEAGRGYFVCLHAHCGNLKPDAVLALLPEEPVEWARAAHKAARRAARVDATASGKAARKEAKAAHVAARETAHVPAGVVFLTGDETEMALGLLAKLQADGTSLVYDDGKLHRYRPASGTWAPVDEAEQSRIVQGFSGAPIEESDKLVRVQAAGVAGAKRLAGDQVRRDGFFAEGPAGIAFSNGFAVVTAKGVDLQPLTPEMRARNAYDFPFAASAAPALFLRFLDDVWRDDPDKAEKIRLIQEFAGLSLIGRAPSFEKCIVAVGKTTPRPGEENGSNGKSTLGKILKRVFRPEWVTHIPPQLFSDEYRRAQLAGKRLNVVGELPEADIMESEAFKAIVTGDPINARPIYAAPFDLTPQAGHYYSCNTLPGSNDLTFAYFRRFILLTFNRTFRPGDGTHVPDLDRVIVDAECAQIVCWLLEGAVRALAQGGYTIPASHEEELAEWKRTANQVSLYVSEACFPAKFQRPVDVDGCRHDWTRASALYANYSTWCEATGHKAMAANKFGSRLKQAGHVPEKTEKGSFYALTMRSTLNSRAEKAREAEIEIAHRLRSGARRYAGEGR